MEVVICLGGDDATVASADAERACTEVSIVYEDEDVQTGGGEDPEDLGTSAGVANPGLEDLGVAENEDDD